MGQQQSRDETLYKEAVNGNFQAIKSLHSNGAGLEWLDEDGKTPLMVACSSSELFIVAKTLIELGANITSFRAGGDGGTPLHHAAKRGLHQTVKLLLSHGANPLLRNLAGKTPLDVARTVGSVHVVREIEGHISFFSGLLREFCGPIILEALAPRLLSRKIWVVIIPSCLHHDPNLPLKLELLIYPTLLDFRPRTIIHLLNADISEPNLNESDPMLIIFDKSNKTRYAFASANDGDKEQLQCLYNSCKGISQSNQSANDTNGWEGSAYKPTHNGWVPPKSARPSNHSSQPAAQENNGWTPSEPISIEEHNGWGPPESTRPSNHSCQPAAQEYNRWGPPEPISIEEHNGWAPPESTRPSNHSSQPATQEYNGWAPSGSISIEEHNGWGPPESTKPSNHSSQPATQDYNGQGPSESISIEEYTGWGVPESTRPTNKSTQTVTEEYNGWAVPESSLNNSSPFTQQPDNILRVTESSNVSSMAVPSAPPVPEEDLVEQNGFNEQQIDDGASRRNEGQELSVCVVCWEGSAEGACIPCGHMAVCMSCSNAIISNKGSCPVCRAPIDQVVKIFAV